jgi:hypothetical protein
MFIFNLQTHLSTNQNINLISCIVLFVTYSHMHACIKSTAYFRNCLQTEVVFKLRYSSLLSGKV